MGMIQTESPYYQPTPLAPEPFKAGLFPNDPTFSNCKGNGRCALSWAVRIVDSSAVYLLGAGLYSWFYDYKQDCVKANDCQDSGFEVKESFDIWIYNLCTKAMIEMMSPKNAPPTLAKDNVNGFLSSILVWLQGTKQTSGQRKFTGFTIYEREFAEDLHVSDICATSLTENIACHGQVSTFRELTYRGSLKNDTLTDSVCAQECRSELEKWIENVERACPHVKIANGPPAAPAKIMMAGLNETCLRDKDSGKYCNDVIDEFTDVNSIKDMPTAELCSFCNVERISMMQRTPFSIYDDRFKDDLEYINNKCRKSSNTDVPPGIYNDPIDEDVCATGEWFTAAGVEICNDIARQKNVSSAALFMANQNRLHTCGNNSMIPANTKLCLPPTCDRMFQVGFNQTCHDIESNITNQLWPGDIWQHNPWVGYDCVHLTIASQVYGSIICLSPQYGESDSKPPATDPTRPPNYNGYASSIANPPGNATVAEGTTMRCGLWHVAQEGDLCSTMCMEHRIPADLFIEVNPSLGTDLNSCSDHIEVGAAYCAGPTQDWDYDGDEGDEGEDGGTE